MNVNEENVSSYTIAILRDVVGKLETTLWWHLTQQNMGKTKSSFGIVTYQPHFLH